MFDWFWEFLYLITAGLCKLIDGVMLCANKLCGIDTIKVDGEETDFLTYLMRSDEIRLAFVVAALIGLFLVVFFSIFAIVRNVAKGKVEESPARVCMKALKSILTFMLVPAAMLVTMWSLNIIVGVLYQATLNGSAGGIGSYLVGAFSKEGTVIPDGIDYTDAELMWNYFNLKKYQFIFSWIACFVILFETAKSLIMFVDRAISIVILFVVSPFSISASVIDDGSHFKLWRDQVIVKFLNGYGTIIALNIYAMICALVARPDVVFFDNEFVNFVMKVLVIIGGAFSLQRIMGLIGNLVSAGAGTQEMQQAAMANAGMKGFLAKATGLSALGDIAGGVTGNLKKKASDSITSKLTGSNKKKQEPDKEAEFRQDVVNGFSNLINTLGINSGGGDTAKNAIEGKQDNKSKYNPHVYDAKSALDSSNKEEKSNGNHNALGSAIQGGADSSLDAAPTIQE